MKNSAVDYLICSIILIILFGAGATSVFPFSLDTEPDSASFSGRIMTLYQLRWHGEDTSDQDIVQYLALDATNLWKNKLDASLFMRVWDDLDNRRRTVGNKHYYEYEDINDTYTRRAIDRIYYGYIDLKNIIGASQFRIGRQYLYDINWLQIDGIRWKYDDLYGFDLLAFIGEPTSYYSKQEGNRTYGGSVDYHPMRGMKAGIDYFRYSESSAGGLVDNYMAFHIQERFSDRWWVYSKYTYLDSSPRDIQMQVSYTDPGSGWNINATYFQQFIDLKQYTNEFSPYYAALADYVPFHQENISAYKDLLPWLATEAGFTQRSLKHSDDESRFNREYELMYLTLILRDIGVKGLEFSVTGQRWMTSGYSHTSTYYDDATTTTPVTGGTVSYPGDKLVTVSSELKYRWHKKVTAQLGTDFSKYKYNYENNEEETNVRTFYTKLRWKISKNWEWYTKLQREKQQLDPKGFYKLYSTLTYYF